MSQRKVFTLGMSMGRSRKVSAAPDVSNPSDGSGQILRDIEAACVLSNLYLLHNLAPQKPSKSSLVGYKMR